MGNCKYCGEKAGLLKNEHKECRNKLQAGQKKIIEKVQGAVFEKDDLKDLEKEIRKIANNSYVDNVEMRSCIIKGWEAAIDEEISKGLLTDEHEELSKEFIEFFVLSHDELDQNGRLMKAVQSLVIQNLKNGIIEKKFFYPGLQIAGLEEGEETLWAFLDVNFYMVLMENTFVLDGKSYKPNNIPDDVKEYINQPQNSIKSKESYHVSTGIFVITNKHVIFYGEKARIPMQWDDITSIKLYDDGVEIQKGSMINSPMLFETKDGWFTYELIKGLRDLDISTRNC